MWENGRTLTYTYTGEGQLYSIADSATGKTHYYTYDTLDRLINAYQVSTEYTVGEKPIRSNYEYDTNGRLNRWEFYTPTTGTASMTYSYDADLENNVTDGALTAVQMVSGQNIGYTYDPLQRLTDKGVDGGFWEQYIYAPGATSGTTSTQVSKLKSWMGDTLVHYFTYSYDGNGNITNIADSMKDTTVAYTYDAQNQLLSATHRNGRTETYTYDTAGNILTFNNGTISHTYTYGDTNGWMDLLTAVDGQSITYDGSGNPISFYDGYHYEMEWTEGRKLASITYNNKVTGYEYNHEGLRIKKLRSDGSYILYEIVDGVYVGETRYTAAGAVSLWMRYILDEGNNPVGISLWYPGDVRWTDYHFVKNLQGDVLKVYKVSDGSLAASYTYDSWGNILSQSGDLATLNPFRYRSYYYDTETWFYYLQSRYYDPAIGRFINADSYASTGQGLLGNNMFAYCLNNPPRYVDSQGQDTEEAMVVDENKPELFPDNDVLAPPSTGQAPTPSSGKGVSVTQNNPGAVGQKHHPISNPIQNQVQNNPNLKGNVTRDGWGTIQASKTEDHRGYQDWHRKVDADTVAWLQDNKYATMPDFCNYMNSVYGTSEMTSRFGDVQFVPISLR